MVDRAKQVPPAAKHRGADPYVPEKPAHHSPGNEAERKLEQGLEESMAGSDPVSIVQPSPGKAHGGQDRTKTGKNR
jgi:hypothetical protein